MSATADAVGFFTARQVANVLELDVLPAGWRDYDLLVSASMLQYVPRERFVDALEGLRARLRSNGRFILFITRRNPLMQILVGRWWRSNLYTESELRDALSAGRVFAVHVPGLSSLGVLRLLLDMDTDVIIY